MARCAVYLTLLLGVIYPSAAKAIEGHFALVIGNGRYLVAEPLPNPANDARDVASALKHLGFHVTVGIDVDGTSMDSLIESFSQSLPDTALVIFYFAGHGLQLDRENYILPTDTKVSNINDVLEHGIALSYVTQRLNSERRVKVIILDACRNNPWHREAARQSEFSRSLRTESMSVRPGLAQMDSGPNTLIVFSTQPDNVAADGAGRNSPFTRALVRNMVTPHREIREMLGQVRYEVMSETERQQIPWDHSSLLDPVFLAGQAQLPTQMDVRPPFAVLAVSGPYRGLVGTGLVSKVPNLGRAMNQAMRECKAIARECGIKEIAGADECIAVALDSETLSVGWSKSDDSQAAADRAIADCRDKGGHACLANTVCN